MTVGRHVLRTVAWLLAIAVCLGLGLRLIFGFNYNVVLTDSMRPHYPAGSVLITRTVPVADLRIGQVAVFIPPGHTDPVSHRIVAITGAPGHTTIITKGDANPAPDAWRAQLGSSKVPVVVGSIPWVGHVLAVVHLKSRTLGALLIALFGIAVTGLYMRRLTKESAAGSASDWTPMRPRYAGRRRS